MRLSIWPSSAQPLDDLLATARHADDTGWDTIYLFDHFMGDGGGFGAAETPTFEATALLAGLATTTSRARLASLVFGTPYRHPAVLANWAVTVDHLSGGRLTLGVGAGWQVNECEQYGIELLPRGERVTQFAEACAVLKGLLTERRTSLDGDHFTVADALCEPKPVQPTLPLLIGGKGERMLGVVARHADAWNMWGLPQTIAERAAVLDQHCDAIGRDPATVSRSAQALTLVTDSPADAQRFIEAAAPSATIAGPVREIAEVISSYAEVGVEEFIVPDWHMPPPPERFDLMDEIRTAVH